MGFSFKENTNDTRESPAIKICRELLKEGCKLSIYDPKVSCEQIEKDLGLSESTCYSDNDNSEWIFSDSIINAAKDSDAILLLTEWAEFRQINWQILSTKMRKPSWVFDTRNIIDKKEVQSSGINIWQVGSGS